MASLTHPTILTTPPPSTNTPSVPNDSQANAKTEINIDESICALKIHFERHGMPFLDVPIPHELFLERLHWTCRHASGIEHQTREFFDQGTHQHSRDKAIRAKYGIWRQDGCPFGPCVFAAGATIRLIPESLPETVHCGVLLDRNHIRGSVFSIVSRDGRSFFVQTGQHLIGDLTLNIHLDSFLQLPIQPAEKTLERFRDQTHDIANIYANLETFGREIGLQDVQDVPALVHLYNKHIMNNSAGELLAAALTSKGQLVFISNKLAARQSPNKFILTSWGGKPDARTIGLGKVRIESIYETVRREGIEEAGIDIAPFINTFSNIKYHLRSIGHGIKIVPTPIPCNTRPVIALLSPK